MGPASSARCRARGPGAGPGCSSYPPRVLPILFIRHAESTMNAEGLWQGQADPGLSERGLAQAEALGRGLARDPGAAAIGTLLTSDLRRATETARLVGRALGLEPVEVPGLRELDVGVWSGRPHAEIEARWPADYARFRAGDDTVAPGGGETRQVLRGRVLAAIGEALGRIDRDDRAAVGIVTHLGVLRALRPGTVLGNAESAWWAPPAGAPGLAGVAPDGGRDGGVL